MRLKILHILPAPTSKNVKIALLLKVASQEILETAGQHPVIQSGKYLNMVW